MVTVWLIRHGESTSNAGLPSAEPTAMTQLTAKGQAQAEILARSLPQPNLIVTSPYLRSKQTAQPLIQRFPNCPQTEWPVQEFTYLPATINQTTTHQERRKLREDYWEKCDPTCVMGEGAESFAELIDRTRLMQSTIALLDPGLVLVFSHAVFIRAVLWVLLSPQIEMTAEGMQRFRMFIRAFRVPNGSIVKLQVQDGVVFSSGVLTSHLQESTLEPQLLNPLG
ncbi:MAG: histidine phosphatase family protein [Leptolyngbyaceae cyanobacterium CRU_2_3]|nr:histidine phosphatase family protein [Leptolyngbyaceae cyanobacterium CRU_2_3]